MFSVCFLELGKRVCFCFFNFLEEGEARREGLWSKKLCVCVWDGVNWVLFESVRKLRWRRKIEPGVDGIKMVFLLFFTFC